MQKTVRLLTPFLLGYFLSCLLRNLNAVIAPDLIAEFGLSPADLGLLTSTYLLAFAFAQLPVGFLLDRFGPYRVQAILMLLAAIACLGFALSDGLFHLAMARALIGIGVSAALMSAFKAFSYEMHAGRQAAMNALMMAAGSFGAISASLPLAYLLMFINWRAILLVLSGLCLLAALDVGRRSFPVIGSGLDLRGLFRGFMVVLKHPAFTRYAPQAFLLMGGFAAFQGLWAVPWLMNVQGLTHEMACFHLFLLGCGITAGYLLLAAILPRLRQATAVHQRLLAAGYAVVLLLEFCMGQEVIDSRVLWLLLGVAFSVNNLAYSLHASAHSAEMGGRANTLINLVVFVGAFTLQWGFGALTEVFSQSGQNLGQAYGHTFTLLTILQSAGFFWMLLAPATAECSAGIPVKEITPG